MTDIDWEALARVAWATPTALAALERARDDEDAFVADWLRISAVPAPAGEEAERARLVAALLDGAADRVELDASGNVVATVAGSSSLPPVAHVATLDDLATIAALRRAPGALLERRDGRLVGPGVNSAAGNAVIIHVARALRAAGWRPCRTTQFVSVLGEETGLRGARAYLGERSGLAAFVEVLGGLGRVTYGAIGITWLRVRVSGAPAHTLRGRVPTVTRAIVHMLARLDELPLPLPIDDADEALTTLRCNMAHAGEVVNHAPPEGWFSVDVRSNDPAIFSRLRGDVERVVRDTAAEFDVAATIEEYPGHAGSLPAVLPGGPAHPLARLAAEATRAVGATAVMTPRGSSNLNVALERAIPAVLLAGERGDGRGLPDEYANIAPVFSGMHAILLMALTLGDVGEEWPGWEQHP